MYDDALAQAGVGLAGTGAVLAYTGVNTGYLLLAAAGLSTGGALVLAFTSRFKVYRSR